jgi:hypothetical protein
VVSLTTNENIIIVDIMENNFAQNNDHNGESAAQEMVDIDILFDSEDISVALTTVTVE